LTKLGYTDNFLTSRQRSLDVFVVKAAYLARLCTAAYNNIIQ